MSFISDLIINVSAFRITIGNKINALKTLIDGKQNSLTDGLHTTVASNQVNVVFNDNTYVNDKAGFPRIHVSSTLATADMLFRLSQTAGQFSFRNSTNAQIAYLSQSTGWTLAGTGGYSVGTNLSSALERDVTAVGASAGWARNMMSVSHSGTQLDVMGYFGGGSSIAYGYLGGISYSTKNAIRWSPNGFVGIGLVSTTSPTHALEVLGDTEVNAFVRRRTTFNTAGSFIGFGNNTVDYGNLGFNNDNFAVRDSSGGIKFRVSNASGVMYSPALTGTGNRLLQADLAGGVFATNIDPTNIATISALGNYYTQAQALALFVGKTGVETIQDTKTFTHSPVIPNATLASHAVSKGQMDAAVANGNTSYNWGPGIKITGNGVPVMNASGDAFVVRNASVWATGLNRPNNTNSAVVNFTAYESAGQTYGFSLGARGNRLYFVTETASVYSAWNEIWNSSNFNPAQYVMISALNTTLAGYATLAGTQTFTGQITFSQAPIVPNGTLNGHTVNLGQLNTLLGNYALSSAIPTNNNQLTNGAGYITASALGGYVLQTSLNTQLANYVTVNSSQNITATKTFTVSPVVPNGTLSGHTVNLGQMQSYVTGLGYQTAAQVNNIVNNAVAAVPAPGNGSVVLQGINSLSGTVTFAMNQSNNVVGSFDLTAQTKSDIQKGVSASNSIVSLYGGLSTQYRYTSVSSGGVFDPKESFVNQINPEGANVTINIENHTVNGSLLIVTGNANGTQSFYNINAIEFDNQPLTNFMLETNKRKFYWDAEIGSWRETV